MNTKQIVKASLFTLMLTFMAIGMIAIAGVMKGYRSQEPVINNKVAPTPWELTDPTEDPTLPESYQPFAGDPSQLCEGENDVCAVMAEDRGDGHPNLTPDLISQIQKETEATDVFFKD